MVSRLHGLSSTAAQQVIAAAQALDAWRAAEAGHHLAGVLRAHPSHPEVLRLHAGILSMSGQHRTAIDTMRHALAQRPDDVLYHNTMGTVLGAAGEFDAAVAALQRTCELQPTMAIAWFNLGVMLTRCVRNDEAMQALHRAVALAPGHVAARALLGDLLRMNGQPDEAAAEYRKVIAEQPWAGMAWWGLADLRTGCFVEGDVERMRTALREPSASDDDKVAIGFALAKALEEAERYSDSMAALEQANTLARRRQRWNAEGFSTGVSAILEAFARNPAGASDGGLGREVIFVVGMPRSGSTLVEQILASHSSVEGAGELPDLPLVLAEESRRRGQPFPQWVPALEPRDWERLGRRYLERTAHWRGRRPIVIDKLPSNWMYAGAIRAMLPAARIIACRREALETCFSCYRQRMENNEYTRTFADLARFWHDFDRSSRHWLARLPDRFHEHRYESLLVDSEGEIRRLLVFCGLDYEAGCVRFHENRREVRSPSASQVRTPLRSDMARAPRYGALLDPLRAALAEVGGV